MLYLALVFALLAIVFGIMGFGAAAAVAWSGAQILFWVFVVLFILSLLGGVWWRQPLP
jgi:uncharacterized membrane protein YtjA (UPF0391 family)